MARIFSQKGGTQIAYIQTSMSSRFMQKSIKGEVLFEGIGIHTGKPSSICLKPAPVDYGIRFFRRDRGTEIAASIDSVRDSRFATTIGSDGVSIRTVEHLLAALYGLGICNVLIEIEGDEIPALDGSAWVFVKGILEKGVEDQGLPCRVLKVPHLLEVSSNGSWMKVEPSDRLLITYEIEYSHPVIRKQSVSFEIDTEVFIRDICKARTYGFLSEYQHMLRMGFASGGSFDNTLVLDKERLLNEHGLRYEDEFVRHKILDFLGDLSLLGARVLGHFYGHRAGHAIHLNLLKKLKAAHDARNKGCF